MAWTSLKKGGASLYVAYGKTFTNNLFGYDARFRSEPSFEISLDLNQNLRTRNKTTNTYIDARDLADGDIDQLKLVQIVDDGLLGGRHLFRVKPEPDDPGSSLYLRVLSRLPAS
jgi:hypothetical protein